MFNYSKSTINFQFYIIDEISNDLKLLIKAKEVMKSDSNAVYEEAIRLIIKNTDLNNFGYEDITNLPWIEDLEKAKNKILLEIDE